MTAMYAVYIKKQVLSKNIYIGGKKENHKQNTYGYILNKWYEYNVFMIISNEDGWMDFH